MNDLYSKLEEIKKNLSNSNFKNNIEDYSDRKSKRYNSSSKNRGMEKNDSYKEIYSFSNTKDKNYKYSYESQNSINKNKKFSNSLIMSPALKKIQE